MIGRLLKRILDAQSGGDRAPQAGPLPFDRPRYEVRASEGGGYEVRRVLH